MGGTRALMIVLAAGLGLLPALAAPAEQPAPPQAQPPRNQWPPPAAAKPPAPIDYLKAGAQLFNQGHVARAKAYFDAAERMRPQLGENEQIVLDVYQEEIAKYQNGLPTAPKDPAVAPASMTARAPATAVVSTAAAGAAATPPTRPVNGGPTVS